MRVRGIVFASLILVANMFAPRSLAADYNQFSSSQISKKTAESPIREQIEIFFGSQGILPDNKKDESAQRLGFDSLSQLLGAEIGDSFPFVTIHLDKLRNYQPNKNDPNAMELLSETEQTIFPLLAKEKEELLVKSFAVVERRNIEKDKEISFRIKFSSKTVYRLLADYSKNFAEKTDSGYKCKCFVGFIQGIERYFLGDATTGVLKVKVFGLSSPKGEEDDFQPADEVFKELSQEAKKSIYAFPPRTSLQDAEFVNQNP